eukprot:2098932-Alexandrium_andersonii.AAC.1
MLKGGDFPPAFANKYSANYESAKHFYQEAIWAVRRLEAARGISTGVRYGEREGGIQRPSRINI